MKEGQEFYSKTYIVGGLVFRGFECVEQARTALQRIDYTMVVEWVRAKDLELPLVYRRIADCGSQFTCRRKENILQ